MGRAVLKGVAPTPAGPQEQNEKEELGWGDSARQRPDNHGNSCLCQFEIPTQEPGTAGSTGAAVILTATPRGGNCGTGNLSVLYFGSKSVLASLRPQTLVIVTLVIALRRGITEVGSELQQTMTREWGVFTRRERLLGIKYF